MCFTPHNSPPFQGVFPTPMFSTTTFAPNRYTNVSFSLVVLDPHFPTPLFVFPPTPPIVTQPLSPFIQNPCPMGVICPLNYSGKDYNRHPLKNFSKWNTHCGLQTFCKFSSVRLFFHVNPFLPKKFALLLSFRSHHYKTQVQNQYKYRWTTSFLYNF